MLHPDLTWQMHQQREEERRQRDSIPFDTGIAFISRRLAGNALIALGTRLTPTTTGERLPAITTPHLAHTSLK